MNNEQPADSWRHVFREGFAPGMSAPALESLLLALRRDDQQLIQGSTTSPPPLACVQDWPCEGACAVAYAAWKGDGLETVGEVEEAFARLCFEADKRLGEPAGCRWLLNFFDDTPRDTMRQELAEEVELAILSRHLELVTADRPALVIEQAESVSVPF